MSEAIIKQKFEEKIRIKLADPAYTNLFEADFLSEIPDYVHTMVVVNKRGREDAVAELTELLEDQALATDLADTALESLAETLSATYSQQPLQTPPAVETEVAPTSGLQLFSSAPVAVPTFTLFSSGGGAMPQQRHQQQQPTSRAWGAMREAPTDGDDDDEALLLNAPPHIRVPMNGAQREEKRKYLEDARAQRASAAAAVGLVLGGPSTQPPQRPPTQPTDADRMAMRQQRFGGTVAAPPPPTTTTSPPPTQSQPSMAPVCRNGPTCKQRTKGCAFHHPTEMCKHFPDCAYGQQCRYIHPQVPCKYGAECTRDGCSFTHPHVLQAPMSPPVAQQRQPVMAMPPSGGGGVFSRLGPQRAAPPQPNPAAWRASPPSPPSAPGTFQNKTWVRQ